MSRLIEVAPTHPCDRCGHDSKYHVGADRGSWCAFVNGRIWHGTNLPPRSLRCWCDGYFPRPA